MTPNVTTVIIAERLPKMLNEEKKKKLLILASEANYSFSEILKDAVKNWEIHFSPSRGIFGIIMGPDMKWEREWIYKNDSEAKACLFGAAIYNTKITSIAVSAHCMKRYKIKNSEFWGIVEGFDGIKNSEKIKTKEYKEGYEFGELVSSVLFF